MATDEKDPRDPSQLSTSQQELMPKIRMMNALLGGTDTMRAAGRELLLQYPGESDAAYERRLMGAVLLNLTEQTLSDLTGMPFTEELELGDDVPTEVEALAEDIDLRGNNLTVFCQNWFWESFAKSAAYVLVDYPRLTPKEDGSPRTVADNEAEGVRPYWLLIKPENVLAYHTEVVNGRELPVHVRVREVVTELDGFAEVSRPRIWVFLPGAVVRYRKATKGKDAWEIEDEWDTGKSYIPIVAFKTSAEGKPPLLDLAHLNVAHWRSDSDQRNILTVTRFPLLAASGIDGDQAGSIVVSPNKILSTEDAAGRYYYVEHTGSAIAAGGEDLSRLERAMSGYGAMFLRDSPGGQTATARALDSSEASQDLKSLVERFEDSVALALDYTADWLGLGLDGGRVSACKEFGAVAPNQNALPALQAARTARDISRKAYLSALKLHRVLPEEFDEELDAELIQEENDLALSQAKSRLDLDPTAPPQDAPPQDNPNEDQKTQ